MLRTGWTPFLCINRMTPIQVSKRSVLTQHYISVKRSHNGAKKEELTQIYKMYQQNQLTSLSPSLSTRQWKNPVWPMVTVILRCNSKSK